MMEKIILSFDHPLCLVVLRRNRYSSLPDVVAAVSVVAFAVTAPV
jgi:hypothetical protein